MEPNNLDWDLPWNLAIFFPFFCNWLLASEEKGNLKEARLGVILAAAPLVIMLELDRVEGGIEMLIIIATLVWVTAAIFALFIGVPKLMAATRAPKRAYWPIMALGGLAIAATLYYNLATQTVSTQSEIVLLVSALGIISVLYLTLYRQRELSERAVGVGAIFTYSAGPIWLVNKYPIGWVVTIVALAAMTYWEERRDGGPWQKYLALVFGGSAVVIWAISYL